MPIFFLGFDNNVPTPKKIVDTQGKMARVKLQVLDGSIVYLGKSRDNMQQQVMGLQQGLQLVQTDRIYSDWVVGELWAVGSINGATLNIELEIMPAGTNPDVPRGGQERCMECQGEL